MHTEVSHKGMLGFIYKILEICTFNPHRTTTIVVVVVNVWLFDTSLLWLVSHMLFFTNRELSVLPSILANHVGVVSRI